MSVISSGNFPNMNPACLKAATSWVQYASISDGSTGLNPKGNNAFRKRMTELMKENGITGDISFGRNGEGKFILLQGHPEQEKIENLLNSDEKLQQIRNDPANTFDLSKGGKFYTNGYDSAYFSEEAQRMYDEREKNGYGGFASSVEETARAMEWYANRQYTMIIDPDELTPLQSQLMDWDTEEGVVDLSALEYIKSDYLKGLADTRNWLETEVTSIMKNAGIDTSKLSGIQFTTSADKVSMIAGQENLSEMDRARILSILNSPENEELARIMKKYLGESYSVSNDLRRATGLKSADWKEIMDSMGDLANVNNDGMKALLEIDPELKSAMSALFNGGTGLFAKSPLASSRADGVRPIKGLQIAISSVLAGGASFGLSERELKYVKDNLSLEVHSDGSYKVGGTNNSKLLSVIDSYVRHYFSGPFAEGIKAGALLNQALGGADANSGVRYTLSYKGGKPSATIQYGDDAPTVLRSR